MTTELVSSTAFYNIVTAIVAGTSVFVLGWDIRNLRRAMRGDPRDPVVRDQRFGYVVGLAVAVLGLLGCFRFHGVI